MGGDVSRATTRTESTPLGDRLRLLAINRKSSGQHDYAAGLAEAADIVDQDAHLLSGKAFVDVLDRMLEARLEAFAADVAAAVRDAGPASVPPPPVELPAPEIRPRRRHAKAPSPLLDPPALRWSDAAAEAARTQTNTNRDRGVRRVLAAVAQHMPGGVDRVQLTLLTGYKKSTRDLYVQQGIRAGWLRSDGRRVFASDAGERELGPGFERLPTGAALRAHWLERLPEGERRVLSVLVPFYPHPIARERLTEKTGYRKSTRDLYVQRLERRRLVVSTGKGFVQAADGLFDPPPASRTNGSARAT
jgi:hypothetical protein